MKKLILVTALLFPLLLMAAAGDYVGTVSKVNFALPKDINNAPLHDESLGLPTFSEAVTLGTSVATTLLTLPTSGNNASRQWRKLMVKNPSSSKILYICFGTSTCATDMLKVGVSTTLVLDGMYFGPMNTITKIYGRLDGDGTSVIPELTIW